MINTIKAWLCSILFVFGLALALGACSDSDPKPKYTQEFDRQEVQLRLHAFDSRASLERIITKKRKAMAVWSPDDNICDVYFMRWDFESLGHEVTHCQHGAFHPEVLDAK